jgi:hypothetical protein
MTRVASTLVASALQPGDLMIYTVEGRQYVKRYLAGPGQVVAETEAGISIDGKPLVTDVVERDYHYADSDEVSGNWVDRSGTLVREYLGVRSYLTLRTGPPHKTGDMDRPVRGRLWITRVLPCARRRSLALSELAPRARR